MSEVPSYFKRYLKAIQPSRSSRERAIQLHKTLTARLASADPFQDWYAGTFLYGSYKRNTAVQPIKDVDVCVLLDIDPDEHEPKTVVDRLRRVLERQGYEAKTALQRRSVRIDMSGTTLDVVPVVEQNGSDSPLWIPDRTLAEWVETHPKGHIAKATQLNKESNQRYVPFAKLVKGWFKYQMSDQVRPKPKGFTLESMVAQYQDPDAPTYAEAFVAWLGNVWTACGSDLKRGIFPDVPDIGMLEKCIALNVADAEAKTFGELIERTLDDAKSALAEEDLATSVGQWTAIFGPNFPSAPARRFSEVTKVLEESDEDADLDDEVTAVDLPPVVPTRALRIAARLSPSENGPFREHYPSGGRSLPKNMWLQFSIVATDVQPPYQIRWIVTNSGAEARNNSDMGHRRDPGGQVERERTAYRGSHFMTCELHRNGLVLARTRHRVNIR